MTRVRPFKYSLWGHLFVRQTRIARGARPTLAPAVAAGIFVLAASSPAFAKPKLLFQDLEAHGVKPSEAAALTTSTCQSLSALKQHSVLCSDDLRTLMRFGTLSSSFGVCEGSACFAKIGRALKARYVVSGKVSRLEQVFVLSLTAVDTVQTKAVGRSTVKARSLEQLQLQINEAVNALFPARRR
ncbi:MAG: hypothetical protein AAF449_10965 [Myxococcota bacterium]